MSDLMERLLLWADALKSGDPARQMNLELEESTLRKAAQYIVELEYQRDNALRLVNNWLSWRQQGQGFLGALENESRKALEVQGISDQLKPYPFCGDGSIRLNDKYYYISYQAQGHTANVSVTTIHNQTPAEWSIEALTKYSDGPYIILYSEEITYTQYKHIKDYMR